MVSLESQCQDERFKGLDIFISSCWPRGVSQFAKQPVSLNEYHARFEHVKFPVGIPDTKF